jgi:hypothetical protein
MSKATQLSKSRELHHKSPSSSSSSQSLKRHLQQQRTHRQNSSTKFKQIQVSIQEKFKLIPTNSADMTADVVPRMEAASPHLNLPSAAKLRPSPAVPGSMESAIKMWLQVGNVQKLQQVLKTVKKTKNYMFKKKTFW